MFGKVLNKGFTQGFQHLRSHLAKKFIPRSYSFQSIIPKDDNRYFYIPRQQWKIQNRIYQSFPFYLYASLFSLGFFIADVIYMIYNNPKQSYRMHVMYPKATRALQQIIQHQKITPWISIFSGFWVKDYVEFRAFWYKVYTQLTQQARMQKDKIHDENAFKLKQEIKQFDKKYTYQNKENKEDVF